jgi:hypothetical protein
MNASIRSIMALALLTACLSLFAHETEQKNPYPGFRPESELASTFVAAVKTADVIVYPTIIRTPTNTTFSAESQQKVVEFLNERKVTTAKSGENPIDPGEIKGQGQFDWFQNDMAVIGKAVEDMEPGEDYVLVMEVLFPPTRGTRQMVFGIHCIVLNAEGENVFSFLLNSHHQMFIDAEMVAEDLTQESRAELVTKATDLGSEALVQQIRLAGK